MITVADIGVAKMTNKEAIIHIEQIRPKKCKMVNGKLQGGFPDHDSDIGKAIDMAIEALENEKQIPKKPIKLTCPSCGFDRIDNSWWVFTYCPQCGQLLDWDSLE